MFNYGGGIPNSNSMEGDEELEIIEQGEYPRSNSVVCKRCGKQFLHFKNKKLCYNNNIHVCIYPFKSWWNAKQKALTLKFHTIISHKDIYYVFNTIKEEWIHREYKWLTL